jgi:hypothetical protein
MALGDREALMSQSWRWMTERKEISHTTTLCVSGCVENPASINQ